MTSINVEEILKLNPSVIENTKVHFAIGGADKLEPLYAFYRDDFKSWQEQQSRKNFERNYILSLIHCGKDEWLFAGFYMSHGAVVNGTGYTYNTEKLDLANELIGRLVIRYEKKARASYRHLETCINEFSLLEVRREKYTTDPFPGFEKVKIRYSLLQTIINKEERTWHAALSNVKGVYLISDLATGKLYVESAYGENAFWSRWSEYAKNGHGGNVLLKRVIEEVGIEYATKNFQYTILETRSMSAEDDEIIARESFWKEILLSREFGYNMN